MTDLRFFMIPGAPEPVAPFSHATECDGWVFVTGQMPTIPGAPDAPLADGVVAQTRQVLANLEVVLRGLELSFADVVRTGAYLTHFERDYAAFNAEYRTWFAAGRLPARTCIGVTALAKGALVEIDFIARRPTA